jgi:hypothetical protein
MLRIDRVATQMDVVASGGGGANGASTADPAAMMSDPRTRERIKELVREALAEHLRELERRGVL